MSKPFKEGIIKEEVDHCRWLAIICLLMIRAPVSMQAAGALGDLSGHVIVCGAEDSFVNFVEQLRRCDPMPTPVVVLHPRRPTGLWPALKALGPVHYVAGEPSNGASLRAARAAQSRALAYLAHSSRPSKVCFCA